MVKCGEVVDIDIDFGGVALKKREAAQFRPNLYFYIFQHHTYDPIYIIFFTAKQQYGNLHEQSRAGS